ncbi:MAG: oligopeptide/dipeptide ABC transporter ATP-binding protein, partial [Bdellovibrionota bacterium]
CKPRLLIADDPTTARDVTIQAQILKLLKDLQKRSGTALILITHDLGVVSQVTDRVQVMYAGQIVERGLTSQVISDPQHPYTRALLDCLPGEATHRARLKTISGLVPDLVHPPRGCLFHPRCPEVFEQCSVKAPTEIMRSPGSGSRCLK